MTGDFAYATPYQGTRVLVLGADGFIGRWVSRALANAGAQLTRCVRKLGGRSSAEVDGEVLQADVLQHSALVALVDRVRPAVTFNLAGYGVDPSERDELLAMQTNCHMLTPLAQAISESEAPGWSGRRLVHVGSALEYGQAVGDLCEGTSELPSTLYGCSKLAGTRALAEVSQDRNLSSLTARLFTVYGPGEHSSRLLPALRAAAKAGTPLDLSAGEQLRDFGYVEEIVEGLLRLGRSPGTDGEIVNLATGQLESVRSFAECAGGQLGMPSQHLRFGVLPTRAEEMAHEPVANRLLRERTGWLPQLGIHEGIARALDRQAAMGTA